MQADPPMLVQTSIIPAITETVLTEISAPPALPPPTLSTALLYRYELPPALQDYSEYGSLIKAYEMIPLKTHPDGQPVLANPSELPPFPPTKYTTDVKEAEDQLMNFLIYCIQFSIRHDNMPPLWNALRAKVTANLRGLGGSYWLQCPNEKGVIPPHPALAIVPPAEPQSAAVTPQAAAVVRPATTGGNSGERVIPPQYLSSLAFTVTELPLLRASALESEGAPTAVPLTNTASRRDCPWENRNDVLGGVPCLAVPPPSRQSDLGEVENPSLRASALQAERSLLLARASALQTELQQLVVPASVPQALQRDSTPSGSGGFQYDNAVQHKFPTPRRWDTSWKSEMIQRPNLIELYVSLIFTYLKNVKAYKEGDCFPMQFLFSVNDPSIMEALSAFVVTEQSITGQSEKELIIKVVTLVKRILTGESRDPESTARDKLLAGDLKQGTSTVSTYIEAFKAQARLLKDWESLQVQRWLCPLYLQGLQPELAGECALDEAGEEWKSLEKLFTLSIVKETKQKAKLRASVQKSSSLFPSPTVKRGPTLAALPAQVAQRQKKEYLPARQFPEHMKCAPFTDRIMKVCLAHNTCFKCRDLVHSHMDCPARADPKHEFGMWSKRYPKPQDMQVDTPVQKKVTFGTSQGSKSRYGGSNRGSPSADRKRFPQ